MRKGSQNPGDVCFMYCTWVLETQKVGSGTMLRQVAEEALTRAYGWLLFESHADGLFCRGHAH